MASQSSSSSSMFFSFTMPIALSLLLLASVPPPVLSATLPSDIQALESILRSIDPSSISPASYLSTWDFSEDPCEGAGTFLGIICSFPLDNTTSRVTEIELDDVGYDGFLSVSIGNLTELTVLSLNKNRFRGPIPESVFTLRKLVRLSLAENYFTGDIPERITHLMELKVIDLSKNSLAGAVPLRISALRSLTHLSLSGNYLAGRIPALNGLWKLEVLELGNNHFYGALPKLPTSLRVLSISHNGLAGRISPLHRLKQLVRLDVSDNRFSSTIGHEILTFPEITLVNVSYNMLTSLEVINFTGRQSRLRILDAEGNHLQGRLPINLATFENLREINLRNNMFSGGIPKVYGKKLTSPWRSLYLDHNYLTGDLPEQFHKLSRLIKGSLSNNCLECPKNLTICRGGQKPKSQCTNAKKMTFHD
ncbi:PREDICTED: leucine-rich repeat receptor-like protein kinase PEPR1 [Tarenaya hassleriana]|uniref:leucine-rich repeat receptor-like protein kinase PEPR1 n=1 Tax=Tarenaya hassleriana TaxID=28532 RepID=UPI00053C1D7C|nr:PREDICTED: leucine-rich repeat receptor-like protein kinase PEPR1 [Tarenaya hassleriana]